MYCFLQTTERPSANSKPFRVLVITKLVSEGAGHRLTDEQYRRCTVLDLQRFQGIQLMGFRLFRLIPLCRQFPFMQIRLCGLSFFTQKGDNSLK